jgi:hypothetical protein
LEGNKTSSLATNGNGIYLASCNKVTIQNCFLSLFGGNAGGTGTTDAAIRVDTGTEILIDGNYIDQGTGLGDTSDILLAGASGFAIITNNKCYSVNGQGIYVNFTGGGTSGTQGKIVIANNICKDKALFGIRPTTSTSPNSYIDTLIANNLCVNCAAAGILVYGGTTVAGGGTLTISGNILDACGGVDGTSSHIAAIYLHVLHAALLANNYIYKAGYSYNYSNGQYAARSNYAYGINLDDCKDEVLVDGNLVEACSGGGVIAEQTVSTVTRYSIKNNTLLDNLSYQIGLSLNTGGGDQFVEIIGNKLKVVSTGQVAGMILVGQTAPTRISIQNNSLLGKQNGTTNPNRGIDMTSGKFNGLIQGNLFDTWDEAINLTGTDSELATPKLLITNNTFSAFVRGIIHSFTSAVAGGGFGFILNNLFDSATNDVYPIPASANYGLKHASALWPKKVFNNYGSVPPSSSTYGSFATGDTNYYFSPSFGTGKFIGAVFISGTGWKEFGAVP